MSVIEATEANAMPIHRSVRTTKNNKLTRGLSEELVGTFFFYAKETPR